MRAQQYMSKPSLMQRFLPPVVITTTSSASKMRLNEKHSVPPLHQKRDTLKESRCGGMKMKQKRAKT